MRTSPDWKAIDRDASHYERVPKGVRDIIETTEDVQYYGYLEDRKAFVMLYLDGALNHFLVIAPESRLNQDDGPKWFAKMVARMPGVVATHKLGPIFPN